MRDVLNVMTAADKQAKKDAKRAAKFAKLIGPFDPKTDLLARDRLISARVGLLLKHAFFGNLATNLKLINADEWCGTAATDGRNFYYNSRFVLMLKPKEVEFLFGHEVLHVCYDHMGRRENRDPQIWNIADDYAVNADLKRHKVGEFITSVPCLYEAKYDGKSAEDIYDDLMKNVQKINLNDLLDQMIDDHMEGDGEGEGDGDGDTPNQGKRPKGMSAEERDKLRQEIKQNIIAAARQAEAGTLPEGVQRMIDSIASPKMPWRELLQTNLTSAIRTDYSFMRPSRRSWHMDAIMPGMMPGEEVDLVVAIDMSGSIGAQEASIFLGEIQGIMEAFTAFKIHVFCFDTDIYSPEDFTSDNLDTIATYEPKGGGGTDFTAIFKYLKNRGQDTKRLVVFTDMYPCGSWGDPDFCDTTWIGIGTTTIVPPFGTWAYYDGK